MARGVFITFEGGEGLGKSTQIKLLSQSLTRMGIRVLVTREPGGTPQAEKLRKILKEEPLSPLSEVFVLEASRTEHVEKCIRPALQKGFVVICDRYQESTLVYQGLVQGVNLKWIRMLNKWATGGLEPDRIILLDGGAQRLQGRSRKDKFDGASKSFHLKIRRAYLKLSRSKAHWRLFQAEQDRLTLHRQILQDVKPLVWKYCRPHSKRS